MGFLVGRQKDNPRAFFRFAPLVSEERDEYKKLLDRSVYCLRHTAICMRVILSEGKVNIFNLAKNAGTSVDQIERFYARHLPLSREMARNLQSWGS